jgi:hypothetical protein
MFLCTWAWLARTHPPFSKGSGFVCQFCSVKSSAYIGCIALVSMCSFLFSVLDWDWLVYNLQFFLHFVLEFSEVIQPHSNRNGSQNCSPMLSNVHKATHWRWNIILFTRKFPSSDFARISRRIVKSIIFDCLISNGEFQFFFFFFFI